MAVDQAILDQLWATERWPHKTLHPEALMLAPNFLVDQGPRGQDGRNQKGGPDAGFWIGRAQFRLIEFHQVLEMRGFLASLEGGLNPFVMGVTDGPLVPVPTLGGPVFIHGIPFDSGALFDNGEGFLGTTIEIRLAEDLAENDMVAQLEVISAGLLRRGNCFSIDNRLSVITRPPIMDGNIATVRIWPPSRLARPAGTELNFSDPTQLMDLSNSQAGHYDLTGMYEGEAVIEFEESFDGL
jgi:hypothetical protein